MTEKRFVDRVQEMNTLENEYLRSESSLVIVYGRRRVGKTSLINEFIRRHEGFNLYFLATQESELQNLTAFKTQVADKTGNELLKSADVDWLSVFKVLADYKTEERKIIVIDEFQYLGNSNRAFPSVVQKVWDTILKDANIMLILCGSLVTLMKQQTLEYSSPLYGRRTAQIKLKQIRFSHYGEFYPSLSEEDLIPFYAVTGGVPKYVESFENVDNIYEAIRRNVLNKQSYLYEEPFFLLQNEVSEIGSYFSIIKAIAMGNHKLADISAYINIKQTSLTKYLKILIDLDLIEREVPVTEKNPEKSKMGLYRITDNFISFWFKFIYPYRSYLERGEEEYVIEQLRKMFIPNFVSYVYEDVCREKMWQFASENKWDFRFDRIGRYWGPKCGEVDLLAIDTVGRNMIIGECKYSDSPKGLEVFNSIIEKGNKLKTEAKCDTVKYIIFSKSGFTKGLLDEAKHNPDMTLVNGLSVI